MKVALKALGCRLNEAELELWASGFQAQGHRLVDLGDEADLIVINTCAVTREAVKKSRQLLRRCRRRNAGAKLVMSGCYASLPATAPLPDVDLVVDNSRKERLVDIVTRQFAPAAAPATAVDPDRPALFARGRNRAFVKVQDGCRYQCAFCIVTVARGRERSRPLRDVVAEINRLHSHQVLEVVLTGVHLGGYGHDLGADLPGLISALLSETDIPRIRLGSLEPWNLDDHFFTLFGNSRFMPHLHLPLQSGSDSVLRRMGRRCRRAHFAGLVRTLREQAPDINVTTDVIAGFPGETDEEWQQTLDFCRETGFSRIHVFPYSPRHGTRAASLPGQVPAPVKKQRSQELQALGQRLQRDYMRRYLGREFEVLVEGDSGKLNGQPVRFGYSPHYLRTAIPVSGASPRPNSMVTVRVRDYDEQGAVLTGAQQ